MFDYNLLLYMLFKSLQKNWRTITDHLIEIGQAFYIGALVHVILNGLGMNSCCLFVLGVLFRVLATKIEKAYTDKNNN